MNTVITAFIVSSLCGVNMALEIARDRRVRDVEIRIPDISLTVGEIGFDMRMWDQEFMDNFDSVTFYGGRISDPTFEQSYPWDERSCPTCACWSEFETTVQILRTSVPDSEEGE